MINNWYMFDLGNYQLITSPTLPGEIKDSKDVILSETPIPGQNFSPIDYGGGGNRKISFTLPIINRNGNEGNMLLLKQFENLRNRATGFADLTASQFTPNPKVLYNWGLGSVPLVYWVKKCDFSHGDGWANYIGNPQYTLVDIELWLDEKHPLNQAELIARKFASITNYGQSVLNIAGAGINAFGKLLEGK